MSLRLSKEKKVSDSFQQSPTHADDPYEFLGTQSHLQDPIAVDREVSCVVKQKSSERKTPRTPRNPSSGQKTSKIKKCPTPFISQMERLASREEEQLKRAIEESRKEMQKKQRNTRSEKRSIFPPLKAIQPPGGQLDEECVTLEMERPLPLAAVIGGNNLNIGAVHDTAVSVAVTEQDAMICRESTEKENHELLLNESPSPSLLHSKTSLSAHFETGEIAITGVLHHDQSCKQLCANAVTHNWHLPGADNNDSASTPDLETSPTDCHQRASAHNDAKGTTESSIQMAGHPLPAKKSPGQDQKLGLGDNLSSSLAVPVNVASGHHRTSSHALMSSDTRDCLHPISGQLSDEECTQPLILLKEGIPLHKQHPIPADTPVHVAEKDGSGSLLPLETDSVKETCSQRILRLLDTYTKQLHKAQSSVIQRVPWGQPVSTCSKRLQRGHNEYLVWSKSTRMPAIEQQRLTISYSSRKHLSKIGSKESSKDKSTDRMPTDMGGVKKMRLSLQVKKPKRMSPVGSIASADPPCPLENDVCCLAGWDMLRGANLSPHNSTSTRSSPSRDQDSEATTSSVSADQTMTSQLRSGKRMRTANKSSSDSPISSRRACNRKSAPDVKDADVSNTSQSSSDFQGKRRRGRSHIANGVRKKRRRAILDEDSDMDYDISKQHSSLVRVAPAFLDDEEERTTDAKVCEVKGNHSDSRLIDLTEDFAQAPPAQHTPSPTPPLTSHDQSHDGFLPTLPELTRDLISTESLVTCPLCQEQFRSSEIEVHAADCGVEEVGAVEGGHNSQSFTRKVPKLLVPRLPVSPSRSRVKCSSFLSDVRKECGQRDNWPAHTNTDELSEAGLRPQRILQLKINRDRRPSAPRTRKTSYGLATPADDLIMIEDDASGNHQSDDDGKQSEESSGTPFPQYRMTDDGGYEVDPDAISTSPIKGFCGIRDLKEVGGRDFDFHNQFSRRGGVAGRRAGSRRQQQPNSASRPRGQPKRLQRGKANGQSFRHRKRGKRN